MGAQSPKHLLIVDDEPVILQILSAVFEDSPWRVSTASSGTEAMRVMTTEGLDLLLTDKNLPDISGLDLLKAAKEINPLSEVIIITGYASLETALTAMELDAFDYVLKPLNNVFDIQRKIQRASERQDIAAENRRLIEELSAKNAELERALDETRRLQAELIQSEKLAGIGTLAAGIAHEIASPLFGILGLGEAILDETELSEVHAHAQDIVDYSQTIRDIIQDLSSYSRASTAEYLTSVDLARVIDDAARLVQRSVLWEGVHFDIEIPAGTFVRGKTSEIQQIFVNLIKNAVEAVQDNDGGSLQIRAGRSDRDVWISLKDEGAGISEDRIGLIFDPFYTTKAPGKGTGLGLNIVYRIVTKYRGHIAVESSLGEGTEFRLSFPLD